MKQDKILSFSIVLLLLLSGKSWSQSNMNFGVNAATGSKWFLPNGKRGLGASVEYVDMLLKHGTIRVNLGYDWFERRFPGVSETKKQDSIRVLGINGYNISFIPIRIGYQHFLFKDAAFVYAE